MVTPSDAGSVRTPHRPVRHRAVLAVGAILGIFIAAAGLLGRGREGPPPDAVALVNSVPLRREDLAGAMQAAGAERHTEGDDTLRRRVLDHLIDQELLVQRGVELGILREDRRLRNQLTRAMLDRAVAEYRSSAPTAAELESFYQQNKEFFTPPASLRVRQVFVHASETDDGEALARAGQIATRLRAGDDFERVRQELGDREVAPVPDALLPRAKLLDYVGPSVTIAAAALAAGAVSDPIRSNTGYHVVQLLERQAEEAQPLAAIESQVLDEYRRRSGDQAVRSYLEMLRTRATVIVSESLQ